MSHCLTIAGLCALLWAHAIQHWTNLHGVNDAKGLYCCRLSVMRQKQPSIIIDRLGTSFYALPLAADVKYKDLKALLPADLPQDASNRNSQCSPQEDQVQLSCHWTGKATQDNRFEVHCNCKGLKSTVKGCIADWEIRHRSSSSLEILSNPRSNSLKMLSNPSKKREFSGVSR